MFTHLVSPRSSRICRHAYKTRRVLSTGSDSVISSHFEPDASQDGEIQDDGKTDSAEAGIPYDVWLPKHGIRFKDAKKPKNWLPHSLSGRDADSDDVADGPEGPFPLNPSFRPPPPLSDALRTQIYTQFMADPINNSVRRLAERYHLSLKRVDAVLRLKGLEAQFIKKKVLQTGFQAGMETVLGVPSEVPDVEGEYAQDKSWYDTVQADTLDQEEGKNIARRRYQRMFWEAVPDGSDPIMPVVLENHQKALDARHKGYRDAKADPLVMPRYANNPPKVNVIQRDGRPAVKFVDVGGKFVDVKDRLKRIKLAERRRRMKDESPYKLTTPY